MRQFSGPIPGQSLTTTPKNFPWERPPEIVDPEEAIQMHITRLSNPEMLEAALNLIEFEGLDIKTVTQGIMRGAVAKGIHNIDVGLIVAPVVHEFIKEATKAAGIEAEDGFEDKAAQRDQRDYALSARSKKQLETVKSTPKEVVAEIKEEPKQKPRGLMARGEV